MNRAVLLAFSCVFIRAVSAQSITSCSAERRASDLQSCLTNIGNFVQDSVRFRFGSSFYDRCPQGLLGVKPSCFIPMAYQLPQSIESLMFPDGSFNPANIDRYLEVTFTSRPGSYVGCGNEFHSKETTRFTADPLSSNTIHSWDARDAPDITWTADPSQFYSLLVVDVGNGFLHGIYINIPGNDMSRADAVKPYHGPQNSNEVGNVYAFILYSQQGRAVADQRLVIINPMQPFKPNEFAMFQNLTGPIAMNWILATGDPYSAEIQRSIGIIDNCPRFVAEGITAVPRPFIPSDPLFVLGLNVTFTSDAITFSSCCQIYTQKATRVVVNPLGDGIVKPGTVTTTPTIKLSRSTIFFRPETGFAGKVYTLIMVDPDVPFPAAGTNERPLLHWLVINILNGTVTSGQEIESYRGPSPPDNKPHYYYYLMYEQSEPVDPNSHTTFTGASCSGGIATRCQFDINGYVVANNLKLVGATWMVANNDEYVRHSRVNRGTPIEDVCKGIPGFVEGCVPLSGGPSVVVSVMTVLLSALIVMGLGY